MTNTKYKVGIVGIGMVGLPLKRYFERKKGFIRGKNLFLCDIDPQKDYFDNVNEASVVFVAVPTPRGDEGRANLSAIDSVLKNMSSGKIAVIKSTVPPGATQKLQDRFPGLKILFNPEFLTESSAWENTINPDRQLVGWTANSRDVAPMVLSLLPPAPLQSPSDKLDLTAVEAEIVKYASNMFLTRKVTFANAVYDIAEHHGADYENIRMGIASDKRIGSSHLDVHHQGYRGYGGYCFVKDTQALIAHCREAGLEHCADLFAADRKYNDALLAKQELTSEDVSVHDHEWIKGLVQKSKPKA